MSAARTISASLAASRARLEPNEAIFKLAGGVTLYVRVDAHLTEESIGASLNQGVWPNGKKLAFICADRARVRVDEDHAVWFGSTSVEMPWPELIKLADFLHLDIPQPELPAGQEVPR